MMQSISSADRILASVEKSLYLLAITSLLYRGLTIHGLKISDIIFLLSFIVFILSNSFRLRLPKYLVFLYGFFLISIIISWALNEFYSPLIVSTTIARYLFGFAILTITYNYIYTGIVSFEDVSSWMIIVGLASAILAITVSVLYTIGYLPEWASSAVFGSGRARAMPFYYDPNHYASVLSIPYVLSLYRLKTKWKISNILITGLLIGGIVATGSRTGLGIILMALFFMFSRVILDKWNLMAIIGVPPLSLILLDYNLIDIIMYVMGLEFLGRVGGLSSGIQRRLELTRATLNTWINYPIFGAGPERFILNHPTISSSASSHNTFAGVLSQFGIFGGIILLSLLILVFRNIISNFLSEKPYTLVLSVVLLVMLGWALFLNILPSRRVWFSIGLVVGVFHKQRSISLE